MIEDSFGNLQYELNGRKTLNKSILAIACTDVLNSPYWTIITFREKSFEKTAWLQGKIFCSVNFIMT